MHILMLCYSRSKVNKVVPCSVWENTCFQYVSEMHTYLDAVLQHVKVNKVGPCSILGTHVFLSIFMSMLYVSDMHAYLDAVLQQVKSEQGRSLQCLGKICVSIDTYVNVIRQRYAYIS